MIKLVSIFCIWFTFSGLIIYRDFFHRVHKLPELKLDPQKHKLYLEKDSIFFKSLSFENPKSVPEKESEFFTIGQIISQTIPTGLLQGELSTRVDLSKNLSAKLKLDQYKNPIGTALGIVEVDKTLNEKIRIGDRVQIYFYSNQKTKGEGIVLDRLETSATKNTIVFQVYDGKNWYPGANCEIHFPKISFTPFSIPKSALVNFSKGDHIFLLEEDGGISSQKITVVSESPEEFVVLGTTKKNKVLVKRAVLLKPVFERALEKGNIP